MSDAAPLTDRPRSPVGRVLAGHWLLWYAVALHTTWAACLAGWPTSGQATAPSAIVRLFLGSSTVAAVALGASSIMVMYPLVFDRRLSAVGAALLFPQQFLLFVSAGAAVQAVLLGQFADGVQRGAAFILLDQSPSILIALLHTAALLDRYRAGIGATAARIALRYAGGAASWIVGVIVALIFARMQQGRWNPES